MSIRCRSVEYRDIYLGQPEPQFVALNAHPLLMLLVSEQRCAASHTRVYERADAGIRYPRILAAPLPVNQVSQHTLRYTLKLELTRVRKPQVRLERFQMAAEEPRAKALKTKFLKRTWNAAPCALSAYRNHRQIARMSRILKRRANSPMQDGCPLIRSQP